MLNEYEHQNTIKIFITSHGTRWNGGVAL